MIEAAQQWYAATQPFGSLLVVAFNSTVLAAAVIVGLRLLEEIRDANHP